MKTTPYKVPKLTDAEKALVSKINDGWDKNKALSTLKSSMQIAVTVELATIPIYLYTYYSIIRTPKSATPKDADAFPKTAVSRFADRAGALIMSVAIEEMLHLSLSSNVLYSLGQDPQIYGQSPSSYPAVLPHHAQNVKGGTRNEPWNIPIPLAKFSFDQLSHLLAIEYPAPADATPEGDNWDTIGQIYSYVRCIICSRWIEDSDFQVRGASDASQIQAAEFQPNCIDTVSPNAAFDYAAPVAPLEPGSTASVTDFASDEDSHLGDSELLTISSCEDAMEAIATISFQGEGFAQGAYGDSCKDELSHYYKFLALQSKLACYTQDYIDDGQQLKNTVAPLPAAPPVPASQFTDGDLTTFVVPALDNPVAGNFGEGRKELVDIADGLYQYMLIMTETIFRVPPDKQKIYFNRTMHQSMIWTLDKFLQVLRKIPTANGGNTLSATFANIPLGHRKDAFTTLKQMVKDFEANHGTAPWYEKAQMGYLLTKICELPDVGVYWGSAPPALNPAYLDLPPVEQGTGSGKPPVSPRSRIVESGPYAGAPKWPVKPPMDGELPSGAVRHACMGLNSCENQGRTSSNECAGQGYCGTALSYNPVDPKNPVVLDHSCHVLNDCRNQGGCGLYGTEAEFALPGSNECQSLGSCATPINAERFITDGDLRGSSVWSQARAVFKKKVWPGLREANSSLPADPPDVPGSTANVSLFQYGPTIEWIENDNGNQGMTACGASGMSGAGSCT